MQAMDDMALLREYAGHDSEAAFETLVSRRIGFVLFGGVAAGARPASLGSFRCYSMMRTHRDAGCVESEIGHSKAAEQRTKVAHSASCGFLIPKPPSPGRGGRKPVGNSFAPSGA
jgi:hypothetical protein